MAERERETTRAEAQREVTERPQQVPAPKTPERAASAPTARSAARTAEKTATKGLHVAGAIAGKGAEKLTDFVAGVFEGLMGAPPQKPKTFTVAELATSAEARRQNILQQRARRERDEALDHITDDVKRGKNLSAQDVRKLALDDLEGIRAHGDAHIEKLVREREEERKRERERSQGRERER